MSDLDSAAGSSEAAPEAIPPGRRRGRRTVAAALALALLAGGCAVMALRDDQPSGTRADAESGKNSGPVDENTAQRQARESGKRTEVATLTDEFSTTYANPDGTFTYTSSVEPVRARNAKGKWAPIDTSLRRMKGGWSTVNSPYPVTFAAGDPGYAPAAEARANTGSSSSTAVRTASYRTVDRASTYHAAVPTAEQPGSWTPLLSMDAEGHEVNVEWPGELPQPVVDGNRALYESVLPDVDLLLTTRDTGFTNVLVVHTPEAAAELAGTPPRYRVTSPTLSFSLDPATDVLKGKDREANEIVVAPTPFLWDSAGTHDTDAPAADPEAATGTNEDPEVVEESTAPGGGTPADENPENRPDHNPEVRPGAEPAAYADQAGSGETLALPGLSGPGEGARAATAAASLSDDGVLTVIPPSGYLDRAEAPEYPLFLDPSMVGTRANWTSVYKKYPSSSFYDGANYNEDTKEARVGFERDTWGTSRSFFRFKLRHSIKNADVSSATMKVLETHSWSCSKRTMQVWRTDPFSSGTTWNRQPGWKEKITSKSFAYGWKSASSCPDASVNFTVTSLAQDAADAGWLSFNVGLVASTSSSAPTASATALETDTYSWKKFRAEGDGSPTVLITYNRKPSTPTSVTMSPGSCDTSAKPYIRVGKTTPSATARATDPDGVLVELEFEIWQDEKYETTHRSIFKPVTDGQLASAPLTGLANGQTYAWRVRAKDGSASSGWAPTGGDGRCRFTYDTALPSSPAAPVSQEFPDDNDNDGNGEVWSKVAFGETGKFTFAIGDVKDTDIVKFVYSINSTNYASYVCANGKQGTSGGLTVSCSTTVTSVTATGVKPPSAGPNILYVKAVDAAGNISPDPSKHTFYVSPRPGADSPGDLTGDGTADIGHINAAGNFWADAVSMNGTVLSSTQGLHKSGTPLQESGTAPHIWDGDNSYALVTHNGDFAPADGVTDWVVRTADNRLFVYPGDGYGAIDVTRRVEVRLPANAPAPATFTEIKSAGDITGDGQPELFVAGGDGGDDLWVFTGYSGGAFSTATQMTTASWGDRDFVAIADYNGDGAADMTFRTSTGNLTLRKGILDADGVGTVLNSLGQSGSSLDGDDPYAVGAMPPADFPLIYGSPDTPGDGNPDTTSDGIPDIWATNSAGALLRYKGGATALGAATTVRASGWSAVKRLG
ncbi:DNRLRE domain-containing protein [Streptomyces lushanensis]|uniref:DNRLRE domain-containing protein n=1 Tax=Streptomyces lushanensis TaxID=1434255 RepID=UPI00082DC390|nr:DNRLRE domain-containing protein [Streptomyces lushanensis]